MKKLNDKFIDQLFETSTENTEWFGYYNYDVINADGKKMLCNRATFDGRAIVSEDRLDLGWYDLESGEWHYIDTTDSFNWQQGAMLQWLPGKGNEDVVVYNFSDGAHFKSALYNICDGSKRVIDYPIYCVTPGGRYAITLNYERSYWCRAYHYQSVVNPKYDVRVANDDGIFKVDLQTNTVERIVSIGDVIAIGFQADFNNAKHWLEHIMINPSGTEFVFLHRFSYGNGYMTRVCLANIDGGDLQIIDGWKNNDWSHFGWKSDDSFVIYSVKKNAFQAAYTSGVTKAKKRSIMSLVNTMVHCLVPHFIKDMLKPNEKYYELFKKQNGVYKLVGKYEGDILNIDGHPSFTKDGKYMITDSYPDKEQYQRLIVYNTETRKGIVVGRFFAAFMGNPASCDLHPKLCRDNCHVAVDTAYSGKHRMALFKLRWEEIKKAIG